MDATTMKPFVGAVALALAAVGCATETTISRPVSEPQSGAPQAPIAAPYPIPAVDAKGTVYVMSFGGEPMPTPSGTQGFYLHLRIAAENRSDAVAWTIEARDQAVSLGATPVQASYAQSSTGGPVLTVAQGQHGTLDVFYPLPPQGSPGQANLGLAGSPRRRTSHRDHAVRVGAESVARVRRLPARWCRGRNLAGLVVGRRFYPWLWGSGWGYYPYWGAGYARGGGWRGAPAPARGVGGGFRGGGFRGGGRGFRR